MTEPGVRDVGDCTAVLVSRVCIYVESTTTRLVRSKSQVDNSQEMLDNVVQAAVLIDSLVLRHALGLRKFVEVLQQALNDLGTLFKLDPVGLRLDEVSTACLFEEFIGFADNTLVYIEIVGGRHDGQIRPGGRLVHPNVWSARSKQAYTHHCLPL